MQLFGMRKGQRPQQHGMDHTENGRGHADAQAEGEDDSRCQARIPANPACAETEVAHDVGKEMAGTVVRDRLPGQIGRANTQMRFAARDFRRRDRTLLAVELALEVIAQLVIELRCDA